MFLFTAILYWKYYHDEEKLKLGMEEIREKKIEAIDDRHKGNAGEQTISIIILQ